jgi:hypothetical protein
MSFAVHITSIADFQSGGASCASNIATIITFTADF